MRKLGFVVGLSLLGLQAQESAKPPLKAPPGVEEVLKARVMSFFDLQQAGKFRQAEGMVCDDTKDHYYNMDKQRHKGSQFVQIFWEEGFKQAKAQVNLDVDLNTLNGPLATKFPMMSYWRVENENWCYYIPQRNRDYYETPFGTMKRNPDAPDAAARPQAPIPVDLAKLRSAVQASRTELVIPAFQESSQEIVLHNTLPGEVELEFMVPQLPGLTVTSDKQLLRGNEKATVRVSFKPSTNTAIPPLSFRILISPFSQTIPVRLNFENRPPA